MKRKFRLFSKPETPIIQIVQPRRGFGGWVRGICTFIGALALLGFLITALTGFFATRTAKLPDKMLLTLTMDGDAPEQDRYAAITSFFADTPMTVSQIVDALDLAAKDTRVQGLFLTVNDGDYSPAQTEILRNTLNRFRGTGKFVYTYADALLEYGNGMPAATLAGASDALFMPPGSVLNLIGYHAELPYYNALLQKIGVTPEISQRKTYKTAPESQLRDAPSQPQIETTHKILRAHMDEFFANFSTDRGLALQQLVTDVMTAMPMGTTQALQNGYINAVIHADKAFNAALNKAGGDTAQNLDLFAYLSAAVNKLPQPQSDTTIATLDINGMIMGGDNDAPDIVSANPYADTLHTIADDDTIKALIIRVNSPGGTPQGAEKIRAAIAAVKAAGKPVYVAMGAVAASGGYWIIADATTIGVQRLTVTGSIGVYGGKMNLQNLATKIGVNTYSFETTPTAAMYSFLKPYSVAGAQANEQMLDDVYANFKTVVAQGRGLKPDVVEELAQGKVYMGAEAVKNGLADIIADWPAIENLAAKNLGFADRFAVTFVDMTPHAAPLSLLEDFIGGHVMSLWQNQIKNQVRLQQSGTVLHLPTLQ